MNDKLAYMWLVWWVCLVFTVRDIIAGSLYAIPQGLLWVYVSGKLIKEYFDDNDNDYPDCLGI